MKQKIISFVKGVFIYGIPWGLMRYYIDGVTMTHAIKAVFGFGVFMALGDMFVFPRVFKKIKNKE